MSKTLAMKALSVLAVGILLAHLSPLATGILLCIGDGTDPDCCLEPHSSQSRVEETKPLLDGSDCDCCITVDAASSTAGATSHKASLDVLSGSGLPGNGVSPTGTRIARPGSHDPGNSCLSSLRTVVLLI
jgi:hypothetical protein